MLWALWVLVLAGATLGVSLALRSSPRQLPLVLLIAILAFVLRGGIMAAGFYGLEYEDAYVYAAASRQLDSVGSRGAGLNVCAVGSLEDCLTSESFPGHLPGWPALLYAVQGILGFHSWLAPTVGAVVSSLAALAVWWAALTTYRSRFVAAGSAFLYAVTPVFALYGGSALSESVSSLPIAVAVGATAAARRSTQPKEWWSWHVLVLGAVGLAALVRRENAILIGILPACLLAYPAIALTVRIRWLTILAWTTAGAIAVLPALGSVLSEVGEYDGFSFGFWRLIETVPSIVRALANPRWFGLLSILALVGIVRAALKDRDGDTDRGLLLAVAAAALGAIAMYAAHVRSAYQLMGVPVEPFDFLRYLSNLAVFLCILAPAAVVGIRRFRIARGLIWCAGGSIVALYLLLSTMAAWTLRTEMVETEQRVRTSPAQGAVAAASAMGNRFPIVTLESMVVQVHGDPNTKTIALPFLTPELVRESGGTVLYLRQDHYQNDVNRRRYSESLSALPVKNVVELRKGQGWSVLAMGAERIP